MDTGSHMVYRGQREVPLTSLEFRVLHEFLIHPQQVLSKEVLLDRVWGYDFDNTSNVLEVYMNFLRKKIDSNFSKKLLHTVRGVGYVLREEV